ncbi:hypothetical protein H0H93_000200 [Arthromyces matolae]|nr:hypothetical protein H0H93_000200 [Arthromyces matolae]
MEFTWADYYSFPRPSSSYSTMESMNPASLASFSALLTPTESNAFHTFLSSVNGPALEDWINVDDKQSLTKATKDLLSLDTQFAVHGEHLFNHLIHPSPSSSHLPHPMLPHHPHSDSSSRTPTPTSAPPFQHYQQQSGRQSTRIRSSQPPPYPPSPLPKQRRTSRCSGSGSPLLKPLPPPPKPALLTASQKKANHIQSEQKRRANIRRGYEALCECVPALREAIREEEEALTAANVSSLSKTSNASGKRKAKSTIKGKSGDEKLDGRAGPRSENVVLSKTIDYINELLDDRRTLLARLHRARSSLPPGHPALIPLKQYSAAEEPDADDEDYIPLWEQEWKGGQGMIIDGDDEDSS